VYYPGTASLAQAAQFVLKPGQEVAGLDFSLQRLATASVQGTVSKPDGQPAAGVTLQMTAVLPPGPFASEAPLVLGSKSGPDGRFRISQVTPGDYKLIARGSLEPPAPARGGPVTPGVAGAYWAQADISVAGTDVSGVALTIEPGVTIAGLVRFDGRSIKPPANLAQIRLAVVPPSVMDQRPGTSITTIAFTTASPVRPDGTFEIANAAPGTYRLLIAGSALDNTGWLARSAMLGQRDLLDGVFELTRADSGGKLVVTFSDAAAELSGTLETTAGAPVSDVFVIAFGAERRFWGPGARRVKAVRPGVDGRYAIAGLPPGDYLIAAVTDVDADEWQDPAFLDRLVPAAVKISIAEGEKKVQDLRLGTR
jgi:hypothetical protein